MVAEMIAPTGLAPWVAERVRTHQPLVSLRDYQNEAVDYIAHAVADDGKRRVVVVLPTGAGKTVVFGALAHAWLSDAMGRVLVLAHRDELIQQAVAKLAVWIPRHLIGIVKAQQDEVSAPVVVASVQTLRNARRLSRVGQFGLIVVDECHHASAASYRTILTELGAFSQDGPIVVGVTATPKRGDGVRLDDVFEGVVYAKTYTDMVAARYLVPVESRVFDLVEQQTFGKARLGIDGDYSEGWLEGVMLRANAPDKIVEAWQQEARDRRTIVFTPTVSVAKAVSEAFRAAGVSAAWVSGALPLRERRDVLSGLQTGRIQVVANCLDDQTEILTERGWIGIDDIQPDDHTATVNTATGVFEWQPISRIVRRDRAPAERMVRVKNQSLDIRVTEGHRVVVKAHGARAWSVVEARSLPGRRGSYDLPLAGRHEPSGVPLTDWELRFLGLFATDGSLIVKRASIEIAQSATSATCAAIEEILTNCEFDWKVTARTGRTPAGEDRPYRIYRIPKGNIGGQLARRGWGRLSEWIDKSLSPRLSACTAQQFKHLVFGLWLGDGLKHYEGKRGAPSPTICGADRVMFDRLQAWASGLGFATSLSWQPNGTSQLGYLRIRPRAYVGTNNHTVATSGGNPAQFEDGWRPERVWCVTNENGTIVTRRNGRVVVLGQCAVLTEGFDEPSVSCIVVGRPTMNESLYIQMVGRGTRLAEGKTNCIAEGERVLTDHGLVPIERVTTAMKVWDGISFVSHCGAILRDSQEVISYAGLTATPDHRVWTDDGWRTFGECAEKNIPIRVTGDGRHPVREDDRRGRNARHEGAPSDAACSLRDVRGRGAEAAGQPASRFGRLPEVRASEGRAEVALESGDLSKAAMHQPERSSLLPLRRQGDRVPVLVAGRDGTLGTGESRAAPRDGDRPDRQRRPLRGWQSSVRDAGPEHRQLTEAADQRAVPRLQAEVPGREVCGRNTEAPALSGAHADADCGAVLPAIHKAERRVWDILNAGPRHRFTVEGLLVSNCLVLDMVGCADQLQLDALVELGGRGAAGKRDGLSAGAGDGDVPFQVVAGSLTGRTVKAAKSVCRWVTLPDGWYALNLMSEGWVTLEPADDGTWSVCLRPQRGRPSREHEGLDLDWAKAIGEGIARNKGAFGPMTRRAGWLDRPVSEKALAFGQRLGFPIVAETTAWEFTRMQAERQYARWRG